jgi:hypothetical protein
MRMVTQVLAKHAANDEEAVKLGKVPRVMWTSGVTGELVLA